MGFEDDYLSRLRQKTPSCACLPRPRSGPGPVGRDGDEWTGFFIEGGPSERVEIKRAWEKGSRLPSPLLKFNRD
ncbi:MAG: hypothetical protein A2157_03255 [Deltaproteobacteria bacterium RBG_16_47_11]|nr:MAG: hypothetical protein A2157_03255 [Deltaproteobacteria bacterium RBG_16_47_11]